MPTTITSFINIVSDETENPSILESEEKVSGEQRERDRKRAKRRSRDAIIILCDINSHWCSIRISFSNFEAQYCKSYSRGIWIKLNDHQITCTVCYMDTRRRIILRLIFIKFHLYTYNWRYGSPSKIPPIVPACFST